MIDFKRKLPGQIFEIKREEIWKRWDNLRNKQFEIISHTAFQKPSVCPSHCPGCLPLLYWSVSVHLLTNYLILESFQIISRWLILLRKWKHFTHHYAKPLLATDILVYFNFKSLNKKRCRCSLLYFSIACFTDFAVSRTVFSNGIGFQLNVFIVLLTSASIVFPTNGSIPFISSLNLAINFNKKVRC